MRDLRSPPGAQKVWDETENEKCLGSHGKAGPTNSFTEDKSIRKNKKVWSLSKVLSESADCVGGWGGRPWLGLGVGQSSECKIIGDSKKLASSPKSREPCQPRASSLFILSHSF